MFDLQLSWVEEWHKKVREKAAMMDMTKHDDPKLSFLLSCKHMLRSETKKSWNFLFALYFFDKQKTVLQAYNWLKVNGSTKLITIDAPS